MGKKLIFLRRVKIPEWELEFSAARSSGPGGQNVNKTETKVVLKFNVSESKTLDSDQKRTIIEKLAGNVNKEGELVISEQSSRSQWTNRSNAMRKLNEIITDALIPEKERGKTKIPVGEREKRLTQKKIRGEIKKARSKIDFE